MNKRVRETIKIWGESHALLKQITEATGMSVARILAPLIKREHERLKRKGVIGKGSNDE